LNEWFLVSVALSYVRAWGFVIIAPPFSAPALAGRVRVGLSVALGLMGTRPSLADNMDSSWDFVSRSLWQAFTGFMVGYLMYLFFSAVAISGDLIDGAIGYTSGQALDPTTGQSSGIVTRLYTLVATTVLFASGGHILVVRGFLRSGEILEGATLSQFSSAALKAAALAFVAALEMALPIVAALLAAEVGLALLGKAAPQLNVFQLGFAAKIMLGLSLLAVQVALLPTQVQSLLNLFLEKIG
jgi:flagellar biosynthetic protein FliR